MCVASWPTAELDSVQIKPILFWLLINIYVAVRHAGALLVSLLQNRRAQKQSFALNTGAISCQSVPQLILLCAAQL